MKLTEILTPLLFAGCLEPTSYMEQCQRTEVYEDRIEIYTTSESKTTIYKDTIPETKEEPESRYTY